MKLNDTCDEQCRTGELSRRARERMPRSLFHAAWERAVFIHYAVEPAALQPYVPFPLDVRNGEAYASLVAFTLRRMRTGVCERCSEWLLRPISEHGFLNLRTYVRCGCETGIYFLAEWLSNRFAVPMGRPLFGLPYHFGKLDYHHDHESGCIRGEVTAGSGKLRYRADMDTSHEPIPSESGSLDEFLLERYTAFTQWPKLRRFFRVWHEPWPVRPLDITVEEGGLPNQIGPWFHEAQMIGAHYSRGVDPVWMGHPQIVHERL